MAQIIIIPTIAALAVVCSIYHEPATESPAHYTYDTNDRTEYSHKIKNSANHLIDNASVKIAHRATQKQVCIYIQSLQETSCTYIQIHSN